MKKLLWTLLTCGTLLILFGCSGSPDITAPGQSDDAVMVERPQFIDTRPDAAVSSAVITPVTNYVCQKKPPKPPPEPEEDPNPNPPHKYAYVVGISDYDGTVNDLQFPDDDAMEMKAYFQSQGFTVRMDLNRNATADNIVSGLQWLAGQAEPDDEIAFSYSGHGAKAPSYGSSLISTDLYYVTHGYVMQIFNSVDCTKKLVTIDACVVGDFHGDTETGTIMATASNNTSSYDAPALNNGAWTYFFIEAAEDLGYPFAEDIADYAAAEMRAWAKPYHLRVSPKTTDSYSGMFDI